MFIDYVTLLLVNMMSGLLILAAYLVKGITSPDQKMWSPAFAMPGLVAVIGGFHMAFAWPLPGAYSGIYSETSVLLGILFLGASASLFKEWNLIPVAIYAIFAGIAAVLIGVRIIDLGMTVHPLMSGIGFILTGLGGVFAALVLHLKHLAVLRYAAAAVLLLAIAIWGLTAYTAYWMHMESFSQWKPLIMR